MASTLDPASLNPTDTKDRLITAAGKLFADLGYTAVSIREIAAEAGVHFSLVNYHFGSKKELYNATLEAAVSCPDEQKKMEMFQAVDQPDELLHAIANHILSKYANKDVKAWQVKLLSNELQSEEPNWDILNRHWLPGVEIVETAFAKIRKKTSPDQNDRLTAISFFLMFDNLGSNARHLHAENAMWNATPFSPEEMSCPLVNLYIEGVRSANPDS